MNCVKKMLPIVLFMLTLPTLYAQQVEDFKVKMLGPANLNFRKIPKRVVISDFQVNYQTALQLTDTKKGGKLWRGGIKGDAKASLTLVLDGLELESLQQLTDRLYAQYVNDLKAKGFEIVPIEELWNNSAYVKNREKRWDLKSGNGPEKGESFGKLITRPSTQKFIVSKKEFDHDKASLLKVADYEEQVEMKISNQKKDFIFNKVVINVLSFDNGLSETARSLNKMAGYAQVKAETDFKIDEKSVNRFNIGQMKTNKGVAVANVLERQKFDASQAADVDKRGHEAGVFHVWRVEDREDINVHVVKCDPQIYIKGTEKGVTAFLDQTLQLLDKKSN